MKEEVEVGDYVLATKYQGGDPCDHFSVGFVEGLTHHGRYHIVDNDGKRQRANGFRRTERITEEEGRKLVGMMDEIGDKPGPSLWWHLAVIRGEPTILFKERIVRERIEMDGRLYERTEDGEWFTYVDDPANRILPDQERKLELAYQDQIGSSSSAGELK